MSSRYESIRDQRQCGATLVYIPEIRSPHDSFNSVVRQLKLRERHDSAA